MAITGQNRTAPGLSGITQAERSAISDANMLNTAIRLIVERGTDKTTLKDVGEMAGYSRGLAGYRFGSKPGLFMFVLKSIGEEWLQELKSVTDGKSGLNAICAATDAHYRFCIDAPDHVRAFYILWFESIGPKSELKSVINAIHDRRQRDVREWIISGKDKGEVIARVDAEAVAGQYCASITGIVYQWLTRPGEIEQIGALYENLNRTMTKLLGNDHPPEKLA